MELVRGEDLRRVLHREGRLEPARAVRDPDAVCAAIEAAHREGVLHRDLKPENILLPGGDGERQGAGLRRGEGRRERRRRRGARPSRSATLTTARDDRRHAGLHGARAVARRAARSRAPTCSPRRDCLRDAVRASCRSAAASLTDVDPGAGARRAAARSRGDAGRARQRWIARSRRALGPDARSARPADSPQAFAVGS